MSKGKLLAVAFVWLLIAGAVAVAWRLIVVPRREKERQRSNQELVDVTSGQSPYRVAVDLALDRFSGYAILRAPSFRDELQKHKIKVNLLDDGARYEERLRKLRDGQVQLAAFTIDALIKASARLGEMPAVIVAIIDETRGADAAVAYQQSVPNVDALNRPETRFVLTPDSPSETLARVVMTSFNLNQLTDNPFIMTGGPEETLARYRQSPANSAEVYVLWEPYVSQMLENEQMHVVVDSSRFRGYIVDVLVASREYLAKNAAVVDKIVGAYFTAAYQHRQAMEKLVLDDARQLDEPLTPAQAEKLAAGIRWKNTQENFAHFGILPDTGQQHIDDMISNLLRVLQRTGAITRDPTEGRPNRLYFERVLADLRSSNFHPGLTAETIENDVVQLPALSDAEWQKLRPVGELDVPQLVFARGTANLTDTSHATLDDLIKTLNTWPQYYLVVRGSASRRGDLEANRQLAENRAQAAADYLIQRGVDRHRLRVEAIDPTGDTAVSFLLGEAPY